MHFSNAQNPGVLAGPRLFNALLYIAGLLLGIFGRLQGPLELLALIDTYGMRHLQGRCGQAVLEQLKGAERCKHEG